MNDISEYTIDQNETIKSAIKRMFKDSIIFLAVLDEEEEVVGIVTDGDFRRAILSDIPLEESILTIVNRNFVSLDADYSESDIYKTFKDNPVVHHIPILKDKKLIDIIIDDKFSENQKDMRPAINLPAVIMAGGRGTRLDPFTRILPKPLIPVGNSPVIELILKEYASFGISNFFISVNSKEKMLKAYFEENLKQYNVQFIEENMPLGTAGAIGKLTDDIHTPFFVSNCDIIVKTDYTQIVNFHDDGDFELTLIASMQHHTMPYGICKIESGGHLKEIVEKPEYDFLVNTGMYLLNPSIIREIPSDTFFHITDLINALLADNRRVGVFPVLERDWHDVGQWTEYRKTVKFLELE